MNAQYSGYSHFDFTLLNGDDSWLEQAVMFAVVCLLGGKPRWSRWRYRTRQVDGPLMFCSWDYNAFTLIQKSWFGDDSGDPVSVCFTDLEFQVGTSQNRNIASKVSLHGYDQRLDHKIFTSCWVHFSLDHYWPTRGNFSCSKIHQNLSRYLLYRHFHTIIWSLFSLLQT